MLRILLLTLVCLGTAFASDTPAPATVDAPAPQATPTPPATAQWLELQRSGQAAGGAGRLPGDAAERVYQRYLNSFDHPVPENFERYRAR
jgi:hypothetical protein